MKPIALNLHATVTSSVTPSPRVCQVAAMFGLGVDQSKTIDIIPPTTLTLAPGQLLFVTGASGGGKTTLLRQVAEQLSPRSDVHVIDFHQLDRAVDDKPLVDQFDAPLDDTTRYLALAGLNDAFVMLRCPRQLSDGQRYRFALARAIAQAEQCDAAMIVVLAEEFGATLDRQTAAIIARNVRKWTRRTGVCFLAATTHDDLLEPLEPDTLVVQHPGRAMEVLQRNLTTESTETMQIEN